MTVRAAPGVLLAIVLFAAPLRAQVTPPPDSARADSLHPRPDTTDATADLIKDNTLRRVQLQPLPLVGTATVRVPGSRMVFDRDSIDWMPGETVSDFLARVPGVFVARGGGFGRPELPGYRARGAGSIDYVVDGVPAIAVGPDSLTVDPSLFALSLLDRIEVQLDPGSMRVFLWTRRHDRILPRTRIAVGTGDQGLQRYGAGFEKRYPSGWGLTLGADYFGINAPQNGSGGGSVTNAQFQVGYLPSAHFGVQAQLLVQSVDRHVVLPDNEPEATDTLIPEIKGTRQDAQLRASWQADPTGLGSRIDFFAARTTWRGDSLAQTVGLLGGVAAYRQPTWSAELSAWHASRWTPLDARLSVGWSPLTRVSASVGIVEQRHDSSRTSAWATAHLGIRLPLGLEASGAVEDGHRVTVPSIWSAPPRRYTDLAASLALERSRFAVMVGYSRNDAWAPTAYSEFLRIPAQGELPLVQWLTVRGRLAPIRWLTLETVYDHPLKGLLPDGVPPHHALSSATIRSRFLHNFPSGIFDLKIQGVVESWSPGVAGRDTTGSPIPLPGATYVRGVFQLQLGPFIAYYDRVNMRASKVGYVPGYLFPSLQSTYGVRWNFSN